MSSTSATNDMHSVSHTACASQVTCSQKTQPAQHTFNKNQVVICWDNGLWEVRLLPKGRSSSLCWHPLLRYKNGK
jgi:hypothetical protein